MPRRPDGMTPGQLNWRARRYLRSQKVSHRMCWFLLHPTLSSFNAQMEFEVSRVYNWVLPGAPEPIKAFLIEKFEAVLEHIAEVHEGNAQMLEYVGYKLGVARREELASFLEEVAANLRDMSRDDRLPELRTPLPQLAASGGSEEVISRGCHK